MKQAIGVFCSAAEGIDRRYFEEAAALGRWMADNGVSLVYGGASMGLMEEIARSVKEHGGHVVGVVPTKLRERGAVSEYIDDILMPFLEQALLEMLLRFAFFGDKNATTYDASTNPTGTLKAGTDKKYFDVINGFWKTIFTAVSGGTIGRTTIAANAETTTAQQRNTLHVSGTASDLLDQVIEDAPIELTQASDQIILCTKSVWDAVKQDVKRNNKGSELQFESWFSGIKYTEWDGIPMLVLPFWDKIIRSYLQNTTNTSAYALPHRVIYTCKDNLLVGTESQNDIAEIDYWFSKKDQKNYILSKDTIGTMILDPKLIQVAY